MKRILLILALVLIIPFFKVNDTQAQTACSTPPTNTGRVTMSATATAGTYRVWARMKAPSTSANSFYIQIGNCARLVGDSTSIPANTWTWVDYQSGSTTNKINYDLTAGTHVVTVIGNEPGVGVDKILMTKNLTCVPTGTSGDNCPAEIALTPTPTIGASDTTPPTISNVTAANLTTTSVNIEWNLSEGGTGQIDYGTTTSYGSTTTLETGYLTFHRQSISGLTPGTLYHYRIKSRDQAGNLRTSGDFTFTTLGGSSPTPTRVPTPIPTATLTPTKIPSPTVTPTPIPNSTIIRLNSVKLHGIGSGGSNANPNDPGNPNPLRTSRPVTVELSSGPSGTVSVSGNIVYRSGSGDFTGDIVVTNTISPGQYIVKVKIPGYLHKRIDNIITITNGTANAIPAVSLSAGDIDNDNSRRINDYNILADCYSDLLPPKNCSDVNKKISADLTDDGRVDEDDYSLYIRESSVSSGD